MRCTVRVGVFTRRLASFQFVSLPFKHESAVGFRLATPRLFLPYVWRRSSGLLPIGLCDFSSGLLPIGLCDFVGLSRKGGTASLPLVFCDLRLLNAEGVQCQQVLALLQSARVGFAYSHEAGISALRIIVLDVFAAHISSRDI